MQISIYGRNFSREFIPHAEKLFTQLRAHHVGYSIYEPFYRFMTSEAGIDPAPDSLFSSWEDLDKNSSFVFSIGGDGTILETTNIVRDSGIPVMGINSGRLGFLASISAGSTDVAVDNLIAGRYSLEERGMLKLDSAEGIFEDFPYAMNEFTLQKKDASMITIQAWLNNDFLNSYWADGLIVSTPTGSTAYSLSVGGPLVTPDTRGLIISPIAPHNLTVRPIVVPDNNIIRLKVKSRCSEFLLSMDYRSALVTSGQEIVLKRSDFNIALVRLEDRDFYNTLRNKLMWGADKRN